MAKYIRYYDSYQDDFVKTNKQDYRLIDNYKWIHTNIFYKIGSYILYYIGIIISFIYCKIYHVKFVNKKVLKKYKSYFIYANHTQVFGDVVTPFLATLPKRPYFLVSPSNLGIPVIGPLLPSFGALPIPNTIKDIRKYNEAIKYHIEHNHAVIVYPEAHVWSYNTFIRDFNTTTFHYPVSYDAPAFVMVTTYQKRKHSDKPKITIYLDGPYYPDKNKNKKEQINELHDQVFKEMVRLSKNNTYEYIKYEKK